MHAPLPRFDAEAVRAHVELLHKLAAGIDGNLIVATYGEDPATGRRQSFPVASVRVGRVDEMFDAVMAMEGRLHANVYTPLHVMRKDLPAGKRGGKGDIRAVLGLAADMDADTGKANGALPYPPSLTIESSPGNRQPMWLFNRPLRPAEAEELAKALHAATGSDNGTKDIAHVWRIPGCLNWPNREKVAGRGRSPVPAPVRLLQPFSGDLVDVEAFREAVLAAAPKQKKVEAPRGADDLPPADGPRAWRTIEPLVAEIVEEGERSTRFFVAVLAAVRAGLSVGDLEALMRKHPKGCASKYLEPTDRLRAEIERAWRKVDKGDGKKTGVMLGDFVALMTMSCKFIFKPVGDVWPASSVDARIPPVQLLEPDGSPVLDEKNRPVKVKASWWLSKNMPVEMMTWAPGFPQEVEDRLVSQGGWIERPGCVTFNSYRPPTIKPRAGDPTPWLDLVYRVYPDTAPHIIKWFAQRVQQPEVKINHGLVFGGAPGIGKDTMLEPVKQAVGPWNFDEVSPQQLLGRFNPFLKKVILRVSEARDLGDYDRYALHDHMKTMLAAPPDTLRVDEKHISEYAIFNVVGVIITTNHKANGIYLPADDRRHHVSWSDLEGVDFPDGYWDEIYGWYAAGGNEIVAAYLRDLDISSFNPKAPPEKTQAFWEIVNANRAPEDDEMADALEELGRPDALILPQVIARTNEQFAEWLRDGKNAKRVAHRLEACGYVVVHRDDKAADGRWKVGGANRAIYARKALSQRERWAAAAKLAGYA
jgi:hypothetical protein